MLRSDHVTFLDLIKALKPTLANMPRGEVAIDAAGLVASGYSFADEAFLGTVLGLKLVRDEALANNKYVYTDSAGTTIGTNV